VKVLKNISDALTVLAVVMAVVGVITGNAVFYVLAGFFLVDAVVATYLKRMRAKASRKQP
jgi:hypothetical protein